MTEVQGTGARRIDGVPGVATWGDGATAPADGAGIGPAKPGPARPGPAKPGPDTSAGRRDPRYLALRNFAISISVFNVLGYTLLGFEQPWAWPLFALAVGYTTEIAIEYITARVNGRAPTWSGKGPRGLYVFLLPAHITSLAVMMLLYANNRFAPVAFGVVVAVGAKAVIRAPIKGRMRHFMNPSNFGITITLLVFPLLSIAPPYHFTENIPDVFRMLIPMIILVAGTVLNTQLTKKTPLIVGWMGAFVIQAVVRAWIWDVALFSALAVMTGVAFVLFTNYMITDPGTTPSGGRAQFLFGASVGIVYGVLMLFNVVYTLFFAVTIVCACRGLYWWGRHWYGRWRSASAAPSAPVAATSEAVAHG